MIIEILFPEVCCLFGERGNVHYLKKALPAAQFIETALIENPFFVDHAVDFLYLGPMSEKTQKEVIKRLKPHRNRLLELIESNTFMLFTGNALDVLGTSIAYDDHDIVAGLGIFDFTCTLNMMKRFNTKILGTYREFEIIGHKTQFSMITGDNASNYFMRITKGIGNNPDSKLDGYIRNNLIATHLIGPLLILNPYFTRDYLEKLTGQPVELPFYQSLVDAYEQTLKDLKAIA